MAATSVAYRQAAEHGLRRRTLGGIAWTAGSRAAQQAVTLAVTTALARLLVPADFGLVALIAVFTGFAGLFADLGLGAAIVQRKEIDERYLSSAFWLNVGFGLLLTLALAGLAPAVSAFYDEPRLTWMTVAMGGTFLVTALAVVQSALVQRSMNFRRLAGIDNAATLVGGAVAVAAAAAGLGVWSLVLLTTASAATRTALLWALAGWRPRARFSRSAARDLWSFSSRLLGFQTVNYWIRNADNLIVGKVVGAAALGIYGRAYALMLQPISQVNLVAAKVMFPALARLQDEPERVRRAYLRALGLIALVSFPFAAALLVAAEPLVLTLYGEAWADVVPILRILSVAALLQSVTTTVGWIYQSQGRTDWMFRWGLVSGAVTIGSFVLGVRWGVVGVAAAYTIRTALLAPIAFWIPGRLVGLRAGHVAGVLAGPLVAACAAGGLARGVAWALPDGLPAWALLLVELGAGAVAYTASVAALRPPALADLRDIAGSRLRGGKAAAGKGDAVAAGAVEP